MNDLFRQLVAEDLDVVAYVKETDNTIRYQYGNFTLPRNLSYKDFCRYRSAYIYLLGMSAQDVADLFSEKFTIGQLNTRIKEMIGFAQYAVSMEKEGFVTKVFWYMEVSRNKRLVYSFKTGSMFEFFYKLAETMVFDHNKATSSGWLLDPVLGFKRSLGDILCNRRNWDKILPPNRIDHVCVTSDWVDVESRTAYAVMLKHQRVTKPDSEEEQYYETQEQAQAALKELESHITNE